MFPHKSMYLRSALHVNFYNAPEKCYFRYLLLNNIQLRCLGKTTKIGNIKTRDRVTIVKSNLFKFHKRKSLGVSSAFHCRLVMKFVLDTLVSDSITNKGRKLNMVHKFPHRSGVLLSPWHDVTTRSTMSHHSMVWECSWYITTVVQGHTRSF